MDPTINLFPFTYDLDMLMASPNTRDYKEISRYDYRGVNSPMDEPAFRIFLLYNYKQNFESKKKDQLRNRLQINIGKHKYKTEDNSLTVGKRKKGDKDKNTVENQSKI